jgi:hypothetical protein
MALSPFDAPGNMPPSEMAMGTVRLLGQFFFCRGLGTIEEILQRVRL